MNKFQQALYSVVFTVLLCAFSAALVAPVHEVCSELYEKRAGVEKIKAVLRVFGLAEEDTAAGEARSAYDDYITEKKGEGMTVYKANEGGQLLGYAFDVAGTGRCGTILGIMGVKPDRETITKLVIYKQEETEGLGGKIKSPEYLGQFPGKKIVGPDGQPGLVLTGNVEGQPPNAVDAITGASMTTKAIMKILNQSIQQFVAGKKLVKYTIETPEPAYSQAATIPPDSTAETPSPEEREPLLVPEGVEKVSVDKQVTTGGLPIIGEPAMVTDGDKTAVEGNFVQLMPGKQYVQIDLGEAHEVYAVAMWHYHLEPRIYKDVVVQISSDPDFEENVTTVFNNDQDESSGFGKGEENEYVETHQGKVVEVDGVVGQYVRCYSNGSYSDPMNHYIEVEVHGRPAR